MICATSSNQCFLKLQEGETSVRKIAFFDAKPYDKPGFETFGQAHNMKFKYYETRLNADTAEPSDIRRWACCWTFIISGRTANR